MACTCSPQCYCNVIVLDSFVMKEHLVSLKQALNAIEPWRT